MASVYRPRDMLLPHKISMKKHKCVGRARDISHPSELAGQAAFTMYMGRWVRVELGGNRRAFAWDAFASETLINFEDDSFS